MSFQPEKTALGFIPANRGFFSSELAAKMRKQAVDAMELLINRLQKHSTNAEFLMSMSFD